jgi:hypothetical protein
MLCHSSFIIHTSSFFKIYFEKHFKLYAMGAFFSMIYELLVGFYGDALAQHLAGWDGANFNSTVIYTHTGTAMLIFPALAMLIFYYLINSTRFNKARHWFAYGLIWAIVFGLGITYYVSLDSPDRIAQDIAPSISFANFAGFGMVNALYFWLLFALYSFVGRRGSRNASTCPFPMRNIGFMH